MPFLMLFECLFNAFCYDRPLRVRALHVVLCKVFVNGSRTFLGSDIHCHRMRPNLERFGPHFPITFVKFPYYFWQYPYYFG